MHTQTNIHTYVYAYTCNHVTRKNYKHCSAKSTMATSQFIIYVCIVCKSHNNIFIRKRRRTFNRQPRFIHKNRHPHIYSSMRLPTIGFSRRRQKLTSKEELSSDVTEHFILSQSQMVYSFEISLWIGWYFHKVAYFKRIIHAKFYPDIITVAWYA